MPNNNNCGMHFMHFASDTIALHEYDFDNQVGSRIKKTSGIERKQTSMWTAEGKPVDLQASIRQHRKEKKEFANQQAEVKKKQQLRERTKAGTVKATNSSKQIEKVGSGGIKGKKTVRNSQETFSISPNALGSDPRFKELFAEFKK